MKKALYLLPLLLALLFAGSASAVTAITDCAGLQDMDNNLAEDYYLANDIECNVAPYNAGAGFDPVGRGWTSAFTGSLDGRFHKINNLYINRPGESNIGLFGYTGRECEIKNLGMENVDITGNTHAAALIGRSSTSNVSSCYSIGNITGTDYIGGLVGLNEGGTITKSYTKGSVNCTGGVTGGLVAINKNGTIFNCFSRASVTTGSSPHPYLGGLVGEANGGTISNSYATGSLNGVWRTGGLIGNSYGTTTGNFWDNETTNASVGANGWCPPCLHNTAGVFGRTTVEMNQKDTFTTLPPNADWDFDTIWAIDPAINDGYPFLPWWPIAALTADPTSVRIGEPVAFTAVCSAPGSTVVSCVLDFGNGSPHTFPLAGDSTGHSYDAENTYTATLTVTSQEGLEGTDTKTITVSKKPGVSASLALNPIVLPAGKEFDTAKLVITNNEISATGSNINLDIVIEVTEAISGQNFMRLEESRSLPPDFVEEQIIFLDEINAKAPSFVAGKNYFLRAKVFDAGSGELMDSDSLVFSVIKEKQTAVPELGILALPLLLAIVLFVLWKQ